MIRPIGPTRTSTTAVGIGRVSIPICLLAAALLAPARPSRAQTAWEYSPYDVRIWVASGDDPRLQSIWPHPLTRTLVDRADSVLGACWRVDVVPAPSLLTRDVLHRTERITLADIEAIDADVLSADKLILLSVDLRSGSFQVRARELDCRTRAWQRTFTKTVRQPRAVCRAAFEVVAAAFTPLARVEQARGEEATLLLRAGGLVHETGSPASVPDAAVMQPIVRRNDRLGNPLPGGIEPVAWTLLSVVGHDRATLQCRVHSGFRNPLGARGSRRSERLALLIRPSAEPTLLHLRIRGDEPQPAVGYEIFGRQGDDEQSTFLGRTDFLGRLPIEPAGEPLRVLYVKNGRHLLARLPMVPGHRARLTADLPDDRRRVATEGRITGLEEQLVDLVARRNVLAMRVRNRIKEGKSDEAAKLLGQLRSLDTRSQFEQMVLQGQRSISVTDDRQRQSLDKSFADTRRLAVRYLSAKLIDDLQVELATARSGPK